jgi:hypothetical protein
MDAISGRAYALRDEEEEDDKQFIEVAGHLGFFHGVVGAKRALRAEDFSVLLCRFPYSAVVDVQRGIVLHCI